MTEARETVATIQDHYSRQAAPKVWEEVDALRQRVAELEAENFAAMALVATGRGPLSDREIEAAKKRQVLRPPFAELQHWFFQKLNPEQREGFLLVCGVPKGLSLNMQTQALRLIANRLAGGRE